MPKKRTLPLTAVVLCWICSLLPAGAEGLNMNSETIISIYQRDTQRGEDHLVIPTYEYMGLDYGDAKAGGLSLHVYGWGRTDLADSAFFEDNPDGELVYGYIDYRKPYDTLSGRLGRQHVFAGVTNESVDGISLQQSIGNNFSINLFGGLPTAYDNTGNTGDFIYGGRFSSWMLSSLELGLSYQKREDTAAPAEEKGGLDLNFHRSNWFSLSGVSSYNLADHGWREHRYDSSILVQNLQIEPTYQYFHYQDYFGTAEEQNNPFRFLQDSDETLMIVGTDLFYSAVPELQVGMRGRQYEYELRSENAVYLAWLLKLNALDGSQVGAEVGHMDGKTMDNIYDLVRCYLFWQNPLEVRLMEFVSFDALLLLYDEPVYDRERSLQFSLGTGRNFFENRLETKFSVIYNDDPYIRDSFSGVATLQINY